MCFLAGSRSHDRALLSRLLEVLQCGLGLVLQLVQVHVLDVGQLPDDRLLLCLLLVVLCDHLGQLCGQLDVVSRLLDLRLVNLVLTERQGTEKGEQ